MSELKKGWYVLRTVNGKESKVREYLEAEMKNSNLKDYISQILIPTEKVVHLRNGKKVTVEKNLFPGYLMIEALLKGEVAHSLVSIPNVIGFLGGRENPIPMRQSEVNRILGIADEKANQEVEVNYEVGQSVKVVDGPFSGLVGTIEEIYTEKKKLKVMVVLFGGRKSPLELGYLQVVKE